MDRTAYVDNRYLAKQFKTGDVVRKTDLIDTFASAYVGRVIYSNPLTGVITIQWPWGAEQATPADIIKDQSNDIEAPLYFDDYSSYDKSSMMHTSIAQRVAAKYASCAKTCYSCTCKAIHYGASKEVALEVFNRLSASLAAETRDILYNRIFTDKRVALYYKSSPRKYQMSKGEEKRRTAACPKCKSVMRPAKISKNAHVFRCSNSECKFMIHPEDVLRRGYVVPYF